MITLRDIGDPRGLRRLLEMAHAEEALRFRGGARARKVAFGARLLIDQERHLDLVLQRIAAVYESDEAKLAIGRHVDHRRNLLKRMADRIAIAYDVPPSRELRGLPESKQRAFLAAYKEANTQLRAVSWGRNAWICNVVHVLPRVELGKLTWTTVLPHAADVIFDPAGEEKPSILLFESRSRGANYVAVDAERWVYLNANWELIDEEPHAMGPRPWAEFRTSEPPADDYWDRGRGQNLVDGTLEIGRISAHMAWARKIHSKNAAFIIVGGDDKLPSGQVLNGEDMLFVRGSNVQLGTLDLILPIKDFEDEMSAIERDIADSFGAEFDDAATSPKAQEAMVKVRNAQIKYLSVGEEQAARSAAAELTRTGHAGAVDPDRVSDVFRCRYAPLTYADHPKARVETLEAEMRVGGSDPFEAYALEHQCTIEQAREEVMGHVERRAEFIEFLTKRNLPGDPSSDSFTVPQLQGQQGGRMAAANDNTQPQDGAPAQ